MPAKASGEIKTRIVHQLQKNGDIYVLERKTLYDPVKKYNKVLSSRILSKIPKGGHVPVPTRPRRRKSEKTGIQQHSSPAVSASRMKVGMMDIIDHIGKASGIDEAIYANTDPGTAQKLLSLSWYLLATNGQPIPGITAWQYTHPLPYEDGMSEDVCHALFEKVDRDEELQQNFFADRCASLHGHAVLAYDSTTISTYSRNLPDVVTIENALRQLEALDLTHAEVITDNGYHSESSLSEMLHARFDSITLAKTSIKWVRKELDAHRDEFRSISSACPFDPSTHGITIMLMHDFTRMRKYASRRKDIPKGKEETFQRRTYLHLFFDPFRRVEQDAAFDRDLLGLKTLLEEGTAVEELADNAQEKVRHYLTVRHYGSKATVVFNEKAIAERKEYHGYFALVSNSEEEAFECLRKYRRRETIESFFESGKQRTDGARTRVWSTDVLRGRMFVQFVSLCYYEYLSEAIRQLKTGLAKENGDSEHDTKGNLAIEAKLKSWLDDTPAHLALQWFDTVEEVKVSTKLRNKRWTTEITQRDQMFLKKLGVPLM